VGNVWQVPMKSLGGAVVGGVVALILVAVVIPGSLADTVDVPPGTSGLVQVAPQRVLDTRTAGRGAVGPHSQIVLPLSGSVPNAATGVLLNVTATGGTAPSFVTVWPAGTTRPLASSLNVNPGLDLANLVSVKLGTDASVALYNDSGSVHLVADLVGYNLPTQGLTLRSEIVEGHGSWQAGAGCPQGTVLTGGGFDTPVLSGEYEVTSSRPFEGFLGLGAGSWSVWTDGDATADVTAFAICTSLEPSAP